MAHVYADRYYDYIDSGSSRSASVIIKNLLGYLAIDSVLDVGCGRGAWLGEWTRAGVTDAHGVDGDYVEATKLPFNSENFTPHNLENSFDLGRTFALVQSLEVAEHVDAEYAETFVDNLARHGDLILFSAATPGQGGEHHVNEQPLQYWRDKFEARGYRTYDAVRPFVKDESSVEAWYRYNTLLYLKSGHALESVVPVPALHTEASIPEISPVTWRMRNKALSLLDQKSVERLARIKHRLSRTLNQANAKS